eukprot:CAMPEP_0182902754 /NCGR_PEP_ID=MMETSP0034_2-20130328/30709_1 /TAXON_ID=156128 /ORGANISM="Nephroselmis pyriformis, Strain CCMP717" /LENGTH=56 /DNA_ID=CAMNT_0025037479 /DNA_START=130 /DNA_END=297 /DNA_ORIENTATION=-
MPPQGEHLLFHRVLHDISVHEGLPGLPDAVDAVHSLGLGGGVEEGLDEDDVLRHHE